MDSSTVICIIGTRPEAIKMAPVVKALRGRGIQALILATAQHRGLLDQVFKTFHLKATWDLDAMLPKQNLSELLGKLVPKIDLLIRDTQPFAVLAQGDTTTVLAAALASFHAQTPFGHVEAGLRSGDMASPFPEEGNRKLAGVLSRWHFSPTASAAQALRIEGVREDQIHVVGNTVIDSLLEFSTIPNLPWPVNVPDPEPGRRIILVTLHRRENFGPRMVSILGALKKFAQDHADADIIYPVHPNPNIQDDARSILATVPNIYLVEPMDYATMVNVLRNSFAVFTDSGGLQEEAPTSGKPVLVFREVTERPEAVLAGNVRLVGSDTSLFNQMAETLWQGGDMYMEMARPRFTYGDGRAAERIAEVIVRDCESHLRKVLDRG